MDKKQAMALGKDMAAAVSEVLTKHGITGGVVSALASPAGIGITVKLADEQPTPNAVSRYKKFGAKLGLPSINTIMLVADKEYVLMGLSSDGARVKAKLAQPGASITDLPLAAVQAAIAAAGAKQVAELDKAEQAQPDDAVDPDVAAWLHAIGKKGAANPAEGQQ